MHHHLEAFFACFYKMMQPLGEYMQQVGLSLQILGMIAILFVIRRMFKFAAKFFKPLNNIVVSDMLIVYALAWMLITIVLISELPSNLLEFVP